MNSRATDSSPQAVLRSGEGAESRLCSRLAKLYPDDVGVADRVIAAAAARRSNRAARELDHTDVMLIAYADHVSQPGEAPLRTLATAANELFGNAITGIHLLPFTPFTSDGGYAVADYSRPDSRFGEWSDIESLAETHTLMFDCVLNHTSAAHPWFRGYLNGDPDFADFYIRQDSGFDILGVVRPRATPLFTEYATPTGPKLVWTTFGPDQPDLNYRSPKVFEAMVKVVLDFVARGARMLRFDATHFLWKQSGTSCVNLPEAHQLIKAFRDVLDIADASIVIVNETNIPHSQNVTYFGDGHDEAQFVYNFALPSLLVEALHTGDTSTLTKWASTLETPSSETHFFNYTACHDGISVRGSSEVLSGEQRRAMIQKAIDHGGRVMYRSTPSGDVPYEMCITYFDALSADGDEHAVARFVVSQAVALALAGVPAIYFSSMFGARTWQDGLVATGVPRDLNREKFSLSRVTAELSDIGSRGARVFSAIKTLVEARVSNPAFHPRSAQEVSRPTPEVFAIRRQSVTNNGEVLCLHNFAPKQISVDLDGRYEDLLSTNSYATTVDLEPYGVAWLAR